MPRPEVGGRPGFAAPLAVTLLIAISLLALLMLEGALGEVRAGAAAAAQARVVAAAESALAEAFVRRLDSTVLSLAPGTVVWQGAIASVDSVTSRIEVLGGGVARVVVSARSRERRLRVIAGLRAFASLIPSDGLPGELVLAPLADNWWVAIP